MSKNYLLGATTDNEIVFAEFEVTTRNGYPEFTASFDCVRPFTADEVDATDYYECLIEDMDATWCWDMVKRYDCSPSELAEKLADDNGSDVMDVRDCSLYPEIMDVDGTDWYFESGSCGQHDTRGDMEIMTSRYCYDKLHELWDKHHLQKVDQSVTDEVNDLKRRLNEIDEVEWITDYIRMNAEILA